MAYILIFLFLVAAGVVNLHPQRKELQIYWREWSSFQRHFRWQGERVGLRKPFLSKSIAESDPEAAAIVEWTLHEDVADFRDVEYFSEMALRYPQNQLFLYELACRIAYKGYTDPQLVDFLADRLLELDPDNGKYYFLKAWAAFYNWRPDRIETALSCMERCFAGPQQDPFNLYKARVCTLVEKEKPLIYVSVRDATWFSNDLFLSRKLIQGLLEYTQDLIVNGQAEQAMHIHDRLQRIAENSIPQTIQEPWQFWISFQPQFHVLAFGTPQDVELKWMTLTPERAAQNRMQMLGWKEFTDRVAALRNESRPQPKTDRSGFVLYLVPPGGHCFEMTFAAAAAFAGFFAAGLILKMKQSRISFYSWMGATVFAAAYFALCRFGDYQQMHLCCGRHYPYDHAIMSANVWGIVAGLKGFTLLISALTIMAGAAAVAAARWYRRKPSRLRYCGLHAAVIVFGFLAWLLISNLGYAVLIFHAAVLWLAVPLLCLWPAGKGSPCAGLFSRTEEGKQFRTRCTVICGYLAIVHMAGFGLLGQSSLIFTSAGVEEQTIASTWPAITPPRFETNPQWYSNLLNRLKTETLSDFELQNLLPMVEPADIPDVLTTIKQRRQNDPDYGQPFPGYYAIPGFDSAGPAKYLPELAFVMERCGRDALPAFLPFLGDPDSPTMLIIRGRAGDTSVHDRLVELWKQYRDAGFPQDDITTPMIDEAESIVQRVPLESLVGICPYSEFKEYLLAVARRFGIENGYFIMDRGIINHFSSRQKGELLRDLIDIDRDKQLSPNTLVEVLHKNIQMEPSVQQWLWRQVILYGNREHKWKRLDFDVANKPYDYRISDALLLECMTSKDDRLRAMGQHIHRVMQKPLDEQTMERWTNDSNFIIRADTVLIRPGQVAVDDPSHFVRLIRRFAVLDK